MSGNLALDLAGTRKWRRSPAPEELLKTPADLAAWLVEAQVLSQAPRCSPTDLAAFIELREAGYTLAAAHAGGHPLPRAPLVLVNEIAAAPPIRLALGPTGLRRTGAITEARSEVARALLLALAADDIKQCARPDCTRLYVDRSRGHRRTWCGMQECGAQAKMATYRARRRADG